MNAIEIVTLIVLLGTPTVWFGLQVRNVRVAASRRMTAPIE